MEDHPGLQGSLALPDSNECSTSAATRIAPVEHPVSRILRRAEVERRRREALAAHGEARRG